MTIRKEKNGDGITLIVEGRVDTITSPQLQADILSSFQKTNCVTLDFKQVEYVSSAGLRALLIGAKTAKGKGGSMTLIHVADPVLHVFKVAGFLNTLTIIKAGEEA